MKKTQLPPTDPKEALKGLFAQLAAFFRPAAAEAGLELRTFSVATFTAMQCAGVAVGSAEFAKLKPEAQQQHLLALLVIQTAPLGELAKPLREACGDFEKFWWEYAFPKSADIPFESLLALEAQLAEEMPAVEAAQVLVETPAAMAQGDGEKPPGN